MPRKSAFLFLFLLPGIFFLPTSLEAYPAVTIRNVRLVSFSESPMHHGMEIETDDIQNPDLTAYEVQVKPDNADPFSLWQVYSTTLFPNAEHFLNVPYRNGIFALRGAGTHYCLRIRALYGETATAWAQRCGVAVPPVSGSQTDQDGDLLTEEQEYNLGTDPRDADTDGDGKSDGQEWALGTDPVKSEFAQLILRTVSLDFGDGNPMGRFRSQHQVIEVESVGDIPARITSVTVTGAQPQEAADFFKVGSYHQTISNLPPQNKTYIPIDFIPRRRGAASGEIRIVANTSSPVPDVPVHGVGVQIPDCLVTPSSLDFGTVDRNDQNVSTREITLANRSVPGDTQAPNFDNTRWGFTLSTSHLGMAPGLRGFVLDAGEEIHIPVLFQHLWVEDYQSVLTVRSFHCGVQTISLAGKAE